jgi:hypothetical protein
MPDIEFRVNSLSPSSTLKSHSDGRLQAQETEGPPMSGSDADSGHSQRRYGVMGWTPPDGICVPE